MWKKSVKFPQNVVKIQHESARKLQTSGDVVWKWWKNIKIPSPKWGMSVCSAYVLRSSCMSIFDSLSISFSVRSISHLWAASSFSYSIAQILAWQQVWIVRKVWCLPFEIDFVIAKFRCFVSVFSLLMIIWSDYFAYESIRNVFFECYYTFVLNFSATTCSTLIESHPGLSSANLSTTPHQCSTLPRPLSPPCEALEQEFSPTLWAVSQIVYHSSYV